MDTLLSQHLITILAVVIAPMVPCSPTQYSGMPLPLHALRLGGSPPLDEHEPAHP